VWQGLAVYFALVGLRVLLNYRSLRNYLKLPLVERPAPAGRLPGVSAIGADGLAYPDLELCASPEDAKGEWLLLVEPRARLKPEALEQVMRFALQHRAEAVSIFLQQSCVTFWERVLVPHLFQQWSIGRRWPDAPCQLIDRGARARGAHALLARGERLGTVRMYRSLREIGAGVHRGPRISPAGMLLSLLAIPCAIYGLATANLAFELAAAVTYLTAVAELTLWEFICGVPLSYALYQPLAAVVAFALWLDGMIRRI
jgi:hypothetical protein